MKKIENYRPGVKKKEFLHVIWGLFWDFASIVDWNWMTWRIDFEALEEFESHREGVKWENCNGEGGFMVRWERWPRLSHLYCAAESRFGSRKMKDDEKCSQNIKSVKSNEDEWDLDTQVFESDDEEREGYWKIRIWNKINEDVVGREMRKELGFQNVVKFEESDDEYESLNENVEEEVTKDTAADSNDDPEMEDEESKQDKGTQHSENEHHSNGQDDDEEEDNEKNKEDVENKENNPKKSIKINNSKLKFTEFEYSQNFWNRGGYVSVRCPDHHLKRRFWKWNFNKTEFDETFDSEEPLNNDETDEDILPSRIDPNFLIFWDHWSKSPSNS
jgi:hypothetical protein